MQADDAKSLVTAEFHNLTLWTSSDCSDLHATEAVFDSRALMLYPGAVDQDPGDAMLAGMYSQVIQCGDRELWEEALRLAPRTLAQWKAAVQQSYAVREARKVGRQASSRPPYSGWRQQGGEQSVRANQVSAAAGGQEADTAETPGETPPVSVQSAAAGGGKHARRRGFAGVTDAQFKRLKAAQRCLDCYCKGHRWWLCTVAKDKLPARAPSTEEVNA
jgi:hypothetical protein